jgi:hypothetical protein
MSRKTNRRDFFEEKALTMKVRLKLRNLRQYLHFITEHKAMKEQMPFIKGERERERERES